MPMIFQFNKVQPWLEEPAVHIVKNIAGISSVSFGYPLLSLRLALYSLTT